MKWRKWNNILHRDLGYFLVGLTVIYTISGFATNHLQIFIKGGIIDIDMTIRQAVIEREKNRSVLREFNFLHLYHARKVWTWIADFYAVALFLLAITGLSILKGKNGLKGRGKWFTQAGTLVPIIFLIVYFY